MLPPGALPRRPTPTPRPEGSGNEVIYGNRAQWYVFYNNDKIIEYKMTEGDQKIFDEYKQDLINAGELSADEV